MNDKRCDGIVNYFPEAIVILGLHMELCLLRLNLRTLAFYIT